MKASRKSTGPGETPLLEGTHRVLGTPGPRKKALNSPETGPDLPASIRSPAEVGAGGGAAVGHARDKDTGGGSYSENSSV